MCVLLASGVRVSMCLLYACIEESLNVCKSSSALGLGYLLVKHCRVNNFYMFVANGIANHIVKYS